MFGLLLLLFLVLPIVELYVIVQVAQGVGILNTIALLILVSMVGAWLVKREGIGVLRRVGDELAAGRIPANQLVDGFLILFAGALLMTPGFVTDCLGIVLLVPPTRAVVRTIVLRRFRSRIDVYTSAGAPRFVRFGTNASPFGGAAWGVHDVDGRDVTDFRGPPGAGGPRELGPS